MRDIRPSGSGEGAVQPRSYLIPNLRCCARFGNDFREMLYLQNAMKKPSLA